MEKFLFLALVIGVLSARPVTGAEYMGDLGTMVVTPVGSEINSAYHPANIKVIDSKQLRNSGNKTLAEVLREVSGLRVRDMTGNSTAITVDINGLGDTAAQNVLVMVDGMRMDSNDLSGTNWQQVTVDQLERIEIIKGPASVIYGDNASGGVINLITKSRIPETKKSVSFWTTSYEGLGGMAKLSGSRKRVKYSITGVGAEKPGYRQNSDIGLRSLSGDLGYQMPAMPVKVNFNTGYQKSNYGLPGSLLESDLDGDKKRYGTTTPDDRAEVENSYLRGKLNFRPFENSNIELDAGFQKRYSTSSWSSMGSDSRYDNNRQFLNGNMVSSNFLNFSDVRLTAGFSYYRDDMDSEWSEAGTGNITSSSTVEVRSLAPYLHTEISTGEKLIFTGGVRYHMAEYDFDSYTASNPGLDMPAASTQTTYGREALAYSGGMTYIYQEMAKIYLNYEKTFRFPKTDELLQRVDAGINEELEVQQSDEITAGLEVHPVTDLTSGFHYRQSGITDEIFYNPDTGSNENIEKTQRRVYELNINYKPDSRFSIDGGISRINTRIKSGEYSGKEIPGVPKNKYNICATGNPVDKLLLTARLTGLTDRFFINDFNNEKTKLSGYTRTDFSAVYLLELMSITVKIDNIFNKKYFESGALNFSGEKGYYPSPERNYSVEVGIKY